MVATIHSPTAYSFSLFDSLMMLVRGRCGHGGGYGWCGWYADELREVPASCVL